MKRRNTNESNQKNSTNSFGRGLESLESRQMFSAGPLSFYTVGTQLVCDLNSPSEQVSVVRSANGIQFNADGVVENVAGQFSYLSIVAMGGNNTIVIGPNMNIGACVWGANGNDLLSTGANNTSLHAGGGNDTLVALGGTNDKLFGGNGYDNFWSTFGNYYTKGAGTTVTHFFQSFFNTSDTKLDGHLINEPGTNTTSTFEGGWTNIAYLPLFSSSDPQLEDINQQACGDCYFMSGLGAIAYTDPQQIRNNITALGDGTFAMEFYENGTPEYVRVDGYVPEENGSLFYANLGQGNSTWVALMEKGYAYFDSLVQYEAPDYGVIDQGGFADPTLQQLLPGAAQGSYNTILDDDNMGMFHGNASLFAGWINWQLQKGDAVELAFSNGTNQDGYSLNGILENNHMYTLASETFNTSGQITGFWVHNPWGLDVQDPTTGQLEMAAKGHNDGTNDGMVWVSVAQAFSVCSDIGASAA